MHGCVFINKRYDEGVDFFVILDQLDPKSLRSYNSGGLQTH